MSQKIIQSIQEEWHNAFINNLKIKAKLSEIRGIENKDCYSDLELGLACVPDHYDMAPNIVKSLKSFGVIDESIEGKISIPARKKDSSITNFCFLDIDGGNDRILRKGGVINLKALKVFKSIVLVDSLDDYFAYFQNIKGNVIPIIESTYMVKDVLDSIRNSGIEDIVLINDSPYWEYINTALKQLNIRIYTIILPDSHTIHSFIDERSPHELSGFLEAEKAKHIRSMKQSKTITKEVSGYFEVVEESNSEIKFIGDERAYRIRGFNRDIFEKNVQLIFEIDNEIVPDKVDLSKSSQRNRFSSLVSIESDISPETVRKDLSHIYKTLDELQNERYREKMGYHEKNIHIISKSEINKTKDFLTRRDILDELLIRDTEKLGYVGEEINKKLFYLSGSSRLTGKPISILDISPSGTGKSYGLSTIMELMPQDELLKFSRITPQSLYYRDEEDLKGRVLYIEEICGMEKSLEPIRMLSSSGELSVSAVEQDVRTGTMRSVERRLEVDIPILSSGTQDILSDDETMSRFIVTYNDMSKKHLETVLKSQAYKYSLDGNKLDKQRDRVIKKYRDIQKVLDPNIIIVNPFANKIMVNPNLHIVTRKQEQYLRLIYNIAFLRQFSREILTDIDTFGNTFNYIEVKEEDIFTANEIAYHIFEYSKGSLTKSLDTAYKDIKKVFEDKVRTSRKKLHEVSITKKDLMNRYNWPEKTARRYTEELVKNEYLLRVKEYRNKQFRFKLLFDDITPDSGLMLFNPELEKKN